MYWKLFGLSIIVTHIRRITALDVYHHGMRTISDEYCSAKTFSPACQPDEVVVMHNARYGRMSVGKCVQKDIGYLGCSGDVLQVLDEECSGRRTCEVRIPDDAMNKLTTCDAEVVKYLQANYSCQKAIPGKTDYCKSTQKASIVVSATPYVNHIASVLLRDSECVNKPWIIEAQPGQRLDISLINFSWQRLTGIKRRCEHKYAKIVDLNGEQRMTQICGTGARKQHVVSIASNRAQIDFVPSAVKDYNFLIRFSVHGCPDLKAPTGASLHRSLDTIIVTCDHSKQSWHLACNHTRWVGVIGNCSHNVITAHLKQQPNIGLAVSHGLAIFIICAAAILVSCFIIIIGITCLKKHVDQEKKFQQALRNDYLKVNKYQNNDPTDLYQSYHGSKRPISGGHHREQHYSLASTDSSLYNTVHVPDSISMHVKTPDIDNNAKTVVSARVIPGADMGDLSNKKFYVVDNKDTPHTAGML